MTSTKRPDGGEAETLLSELRWTADRIITNYEGERVWLKKIPEGLTDCCFASEPCEFHARLTHAASGTKQ